ncbi:MAG: OmpA family protein [Actinomycetota bacterium]|nr:OmpA family protein [Actinomycetota bacterium]
MFAFGRSDLSTGAQAILSDVVKALQGAPPGMITVTGYTDSIGPDAFNLTLSQARAEAVHAFLRAQVSRPGLTYRVVGMGKADPVAPNANPDGSDNPDGRRQNRRVTVSFRA